MLGAGFFGGFFQRAQFFQRDDLLARDELPANIFDVDRHRILQGMNIHHPTFAVRGADFFITAR